MNKTNLVRRSVAAGLSALAVGLGAPASAAAQADVEELGRRLGGTPPPAYYEFVGNNPGAFRFSEDGVWRGRARRVAEARSRGRAFRDQLALSSGLMSQAVVAGDLNVPVLLAMYANTDSTVLVGHSPRTALETRLFGTQAAPPYSVFTYYQELSNGALNVNGTVMDWARVPATDDVYEAGCNGLCDGTPILISDLVGAQDPLVDFGLFDNDGPDNVPNSGDDDGVVDILVIVHPEVDGACGTTNLWAHRFSYSGWTGGILATGDPAFNGGTIGVNNYIIQGGQGGSTGCMAGQPQAMGVVAHELGHGLGLPDLYDTGANTEGIGEWGLMGSGNWRVAEMPVHMSAWSKAQLGWVTEVIVDSDTSLVISPVETSDTVYVLPIDRTNEYFQLSNRQAIGSDASLLTPRGATEHTLATGLLIWHIDSLRMRGGAVNSGTVHGLALEEADGERDLWRDSDSDNDSNRGDSGDAFPGATGNTAFGFGTNPSSDRNDETPTYIRVVNIVETAGGDVTVDISFAPPTVISLTHSQGACSHCETHFAEFMVDGTPSGTQFVEFLSAGATRTVSVDSIQLRDSDRRRYTWLSWSDGGARTHDLVASGAGDALTGDMTAEFLVTVNVAGAGSVTSVELPGLAVGPDASGGEFATEFTGVTLAATPGAGFVFEQWNTPTGAWPFDTLMLENLSAPAEVNVMFREVLEITSATLVEATMGFDYSDRLAATGGDGNHTWTSLDLPEGLSLLPNGTLQGVPRESGTFTLDLEVESGRQTKEAAVILAIIEPTLVTTSVVGAVLNTSQLLSAEEIRFLDLQGNSNGNFDLGDFLAWVEQNNVQLSASVMSQVMGRRVDNGSDR